MVNTSDQNSDFYQLDKDLYYYQETYDSIVEDFGFDSIMNSTLSGEETRCEVSLEIRSNVFFPRSESNIEDQESIIIKYTLPYLDKDIIRILSCLFYHTDSIDTIVDKLEKKLSFKPTEVVSSVVSQYLEDLFRIEDRDIYEYTIFLTISRFTNNNNDPDAGSIYKNTISGSDDENVEAFIDNASLLLTLLRGYPDEKRIPDTFKICGPILNLVDIYSMLKFLNHKLAENNAIAYPISTLIESDIKVAGHYCFDFESDETHVFFELQKPSNDD